MKKRIIPNIFLVIFGFLVSFFIIELILQLTSYFLIKNYIINNTKNNSNLISCFGDSFTYGIGADTLKGSYPYNLKKRLNNKTIINYGIPGSNSSLTLKNIKKSLTKNDPETIILLTGINNYWNTDGINNISANLFKFKTFKLLSLLFYRLSNHFSPKVPILKKENNIFLIKKPIVKKTIVISRSNDHINFLKNYLKLTVNNSKYQYYKYLNKINKNIIYNNEIKKLEKIYYANKNNAYITYLYFSAKYKKLNYNDFEKLLKNYRKNFSENFLYFILKSKLANKKHQYNRALSCLNFSISNFENNSFENIISKLFICEMIIKNAIKTTNYKIAEKLIFNYFDKNTFINTFLLSQLYIKTKEFEKAAKVLNKFYIFKIYKKLTSIKNCNDRFKNKHFEWAALSYYKLLFEDSKFCISFDHIRKSYKKDKKNTEQIIAYFFYNYTNSSRFWANMGYIFSELKEFKYAKLAFNISITKISKTFDSFLLYSYFLQDTGSSYGAVKALENAYRLSNKNKDILIETISFCLKINKYEKTLKYINEYEKNFNIKNNKFKILKAEYLFKTNKLNNSLNILNSINSDSNDILLKTALLYKKLKKINIAINLLYKLHKNNISNTKISLEIIHCLYLQRKYHEAIKFIKTVYEKYPDNIFVYMYASIYRELNENIKAEKYFKLAYNNDPNNLNMCYDYLDILIKNKRILIADNVLKNINVKYFKDFPELNIMKINVLYYKNKEKEAFKLIYDLEKNSNNKIKNKILEFYYKIKDKKKFFEYSNKWKIYLKNNNQYNFINAMMCFYNKDLKKSLKFFKKVLKEDPENYSAYNIMGKIVAKSSLSKAKKYFKKAFLISYDIKTYFYNMQTFTKTPSKNIIKEIKKIINKYGNSNEKEQLKKLSLFYNNEKTPESILKNDLKKIFLLCKKRNIKLIVQTYPFYHKINSIIRNFCLYYNISLIDNEKIFKEKANNSFFIGDKHCNNKGYKLMADNILKYLNSHNK